MNIHLTVGFWTNKMSKTSTQMLLAGMLGLAATADMGFPSSQSGSGYVPKSGSTKHPTKKRHTKASKKNKRKMTKASKHNNRG